jgi:hypothetical protein
MPMICDVFTAGLVQQRDADETALREIEARLAQIPEAYTIKLEVEDAANIDAGGRKKLSAAFARWLSAGRTKGDAASIGNATIEVLLVGGHRLDVITAEPVHIVETPSKLAENFEEKAKRYAPFGLPVIAAAVKHNRAETDATEVEDVLYGQLAYVSRETSTGQIIGRTERLPGGVFACRRELSAAIWIEPFHLPAPIIHVWDNPIANFAVAPFHLERLRSATL